MQRHGGSEQPVKGQSAHRPEARNAPTAHVSTDELQEQLDRAKRERDEALEQQAAMSEILGVISNSPTDLAPVFNAILANATRLCEGNLAALWRYDGKFLIGAAQYNASAAFVDKYMGTKMEPGPAGPARLAALERRTVHVADITAEPGFHPLVLQYERARSVLAVPLLRQKDLVGVIAIWRREVRPFTDKQIELVKNFAAQAVTAIENTRLLNELRESLQQQTATADVLKVISRSTFDLQAVLNTLVELACRLCDAEASTIWRPEGDAFKLAANFGQSAAHVDAMRQISTRPGRGSCTGRVLLEGRTIHIPDCEADSEYKIVDVLRVAGNRAMLGIPLLREGLPIGVLTLTRSTARPFTEKQIELATTFADQAVIAIENVRLFDEVQQRTRELSEALEQQTATSEVLKVISSSPGELEPVFNAMLANATRICEARFGNLFLREGPIFRSVAIHSKQQSHADSWRRNPVFDLRDNPGVPLDRVAKTKQIVHIPDLRTDPSYIGKNDRIVRLVEVAGARTILTVPMLKEGELIGAISMYRQEVRPFTDKQIELVKNFAAQAVIAIENTRLLNELRQRTDDLTEALEQQTATADVLKVISSSPGDLEPVFNAMLASAIRICEAKFGILWLCEGGGFRCVALHNAPPAFAEERRRHPVVHPPLGSGLRQLAETKQVAQLADMKAVQPYLERDPFVVASVDLGGYRTVLNVPMLKENELIGAISIFRAEVRPFIEKQIELVQNFAAQAVIAIENTRLLNELRESLQQQTATADVLKVISRSTFELQTVFDTLVESAARLCEADMAAVVRQEGSAYRQVASYGFPADYKEFMKHHAIPMGRGSVTGRTILEGKVVHIPDVLADPDYKLADVSKFEVRTLLGVPLLREGSPIGVIVLERKSVRPFTDSQIALVTTFADQAVIAIENVRLFDEVQTRTRDLSESLEQQTATSEVLQVISSSPGELEPVFQAMLENAVRICAATFGNLLLNEGDAFRRVAMYNAPQTAVDAHRRNPTISLRSAPILDRLVRTRQIIHLADVAAEYPDEPIIKTAGARTFLVVPMLKESELIGAIGIYRQEVCPFTDKQIKLVENFAAQAVIAIENTRLLNELRQSLQQQTATADVLKIISRSAFDLQSVLDTLVESAVRLCEADNSFLFRREGENLIWAASHGYSQEFVEFRKNRPLIPDRGSAVGRAIVDGKIVHIPDVFEDKEYTLWDAQEIAGYRTVLGVPLLREGVSMGVLALTRSKPRSFTDKQIELLTTFADQAAIAIENVHLFESVEARTRELAASLEDLRSAQDRLVQTEKLASLGQLTAGIAHEIKNPLNFVNNFSGVSAELIDELQDALNRISIDHKARAEIKELTDTLLGNLDKVVQHGKRADAIVKNMLLHSRQGSGEHRPVDINALVEESLSLAWHGARAEKQGFNITLQKSFDPTAGEADVFPQEITRALLNLISNGFYAATKRKADANGGDYEPTLSATTKSLGDRVEIRIRDNGTGIPPEAKERLFTPFFTTKPAGEGTGLGLSISHDIIVKQHGGSIEVDTNPGEFTEFRIILPRMAAIIPKSGERA